jgi:7-cyano-7-deazaguanine synthase in queuosine biosynthesis
VFADWLELMSCTYFFSQGAYPGLRKAFVHLFNEISKMCTNNNVKARSHFQMQVVKCIHHELIYRHQHMDTILRLNFMSYSSPETVRCANVISFHEQTDHMSTFLNGSKDMSTKINSGKQSCQKYSLDNKK